MLTRAFSSSHALSLLWDFGLAIRVILCGILFLCETAERNHRVESRDWEGGIAVGAAGCG